MCKSRTKFQPRINPCLKRMTAQDFVTKTPDKAKTDSAETASRSTVYRYYFTGYPANMPKPESLHSHPFVILRPDNPDYTARDVMAARLMPPFGALKDKCIQTH
jgi:hypothetical protein